MLVLADKASNNIIIMCKQFYYKCLVDELGLIDTSTGSATYEEINSVRSSDILSSHQTYLSKFGIHFDDKSRKLPNIYCLPKLHKLP